MSPIDKLDLPVPKYCSFDQAVHWLITGEKIILHADFYRIEFDRPDDGVFDKSQVPEVERAFFLAVRNGLLTAYGFVLDNAPKGKKGVQHFDDFEAEPIPEKFWDRVRTKEICSGNNEVIRAGFPEHGEPEYLGYIFVKFLTSDLFRVFKEEHPNFKNGRSLGGEKGKYKLALQEFVDQVRHSIGDKLTTKTFKRYMSQFDEMNCAEGSFACSDVFIEDDDILWTDDKGKDDRLALVSLQPYFNRANDQS